MTKKPLLFMLLMAVFTPWAALAQEPLLVEGFENTSFSTNYWSASGWYTYQVNSSANNWNISSYENNAHTGSYSAYYQDHTNYDANCYLVSPPFNVNPYMTNLSVSLWERVGSSNYPETFEVFFVKASAVDHNTAGVVNATHYNAIASTTYTNTDYAEKTGSCTNTDLRGQSVRLVIHCTSPKDMWLLNIDDITVTQTHTGPYITLDPTSATIITGHTQTLTVTPHNATGTPSFTYTSSNTNVATVSGNGTTATVTGVGAGTATITATMTTGGVNYSKTCSITVEDPSYCTPYFYHSTFSDDETYISAFVTSHGYTNINNSSGCSDGGYANYYDSQSASIQAGKTLDFAVTRPLTITPGISDPWPRKFALWVDWNRDYDFEDEGEQVAISGPLVETATWSSSITVPATTAAGDYHIRVMIVYNETTPEPCIYSAYSSSPGEAEDYKLTVLDATDCLTPNDLSATNIEPFSASLQWNGDAEYYWVRYKKAVTWEDDFEHGLDQWTVYTEGESPEDEGWFAYSSSNYTAHSGNYVASAWSWRSSTAYDADNWLVTPRVNLGGELNFYVYTNYKYPDSYEVRLSTTGNAIEDFTVVLQNMAAAPANSNWNKVSIDLSAYAGQTGFIAIHHVSSDMNYLFIDDFGIYLDETSDWSNVSSTTNNPTFENLFVDGIVYEWQVQAVCNSENNVYSDWSSISTFATPSSCSVPTDLSTTNVTASTASLSWSSYRDYHNVRYRTAAVGSTPVGNWTTLNNVNGKALTLEGLTSSTAYEWQVQGVNSACTDGVSEWSESEAFTTEPSCDAPSAFAVTGITTTSAVLSWTSEATSFDIEVNGTVTEDVTSPYTLGNLTEGTYYNVRVRANCEAGDESHWTDALTFHTLCEAFNLPYSYDFQSDGDYVCWTKAKLDENNMNTMGLTDDLFSTDNIVFYFSSIWFDYSFPATVNDYRQILISPELNTNKAVSVQFRYRSQSSTYTESFKVGYSSTTKEYSSFTWFDEIESTSTDWTTFPKTVLPAGTKYVAILYTSVNQTYLHLDNFVFEEVPSKPITGYGEGQGGWYLIASPLAESYTPTDANGFLTQEYDLFRFNQSADAEWENWKSHANNDDHYHFGLEPGKGYLYASTTNTTLVFSGTPYTGTGTFTLTYNDANPDATMHGMNLIGNPFNAPKTIGDKPFYRMNYGDNAGGDEIILATDPVIAPMEGIIVQANTNNETVTFTSPTRGDSGKEDLVIDLSRGATTIDRAIVSFGEGETLCKFQLRENSTRLYLPQGGKEYAIVNAEAQTGEIPVSFKAESNGTYTLSFSGNVISSEFGGDVISSEAKKSKFTYLHLIDNLTGADIDLLSGDCGSESAMTAPSYTFTAKTTDYESRFRLVFATEGDGPSTGSGTFAFVDAEGNIIVNGPSTHSTGSGTTGSGTSILQVFDVLGRQVFAEELSTINYQLSTANFLPGVYVLRLINGDSVKTQKIVIK